MNLTLKIYLTRIDVRKKGTPTAMAVTELNDGRSEENKLRSCRCNHVFVSGGVL